MFKYIGAASSHSEDGGRTSADDGQLTLVIGTVYPNIPLSSANHCNAYIPYRITPKVP